MNRVSHFRFYKSQRSGIFFLVLIVVIFQCVQLGRDIFSFTAEVTPLNVLASAENEFPYKQFPFNPNYISDFKGYTLGLSVEEIEAIQKYRAAGNYINSTAQFQEISGVSDTLLNTIQPYFLFPEKKSFPKKKAKAVISIKKQDINTATVSDLKKVRGVGEVLANRLVKYRSYLGGFYFQDQIAETYGIPPESVSEVLKYFEIQKLPTFKKRDVNTCTLKELSKIPYIDWNLAKKIVSYRTNHLKISDLPELTKIEGFPTDKLNRIELYLTAEPTVSEHTSEP
ncbi:ComEA family DNA-binding protein [Joostella sp. CR20]|uniref:ComEA family DNA-binding protein n=1 Tax=Joostella sp. CR20 TaxID=2804312 RepID=UPI00313C58F9